MMVGVMRQSGRRVVAAIVFASVVAGGPCHAIFWNNDPAYGVASSGGLADRVDWFQNVYPINNLSNGTFGTATLISPEWALTVRHVVQNGSSTAQIAAPENVFVNVLGTRYYADDIFTPDSSSEIALVHLRGGVSNALDLSGQVNGSGGEAGRVAQIGGFGYAGYFGAGSTTSLGAFRRAYNVGTLIDNNSQIRIVADGEPALAQAGLLEGTVGSGDSGGPMFAWYGSGNVQNAHPDDWRLVGLAATGSGGKSGEIWGGMSHYTRVSNFANWIASTRDSQPSPNASATGPWIQQMGSGLYDSGGDRITVTGSNAAPVVLTSIGPNGDGWTLDAIGDKIRFTAIVDTTLPIDGLELRYGLFDGLLGAGSDESASAMPWRGYFVGNAIEAGPEGVFEVATGGSGAEHGAASLFDLDSSLLPIGSSFASGTYDDSAGAQITPAGRYSISLEIARMETGLELSYSTIQVDTANRPTGGYAHAGVVFDTSPASWTFDKLGMRLQDSAYTGTIIIDEIRVALSDVTPVPGDYNGNGSVDAADYLVWRGTLGQSGSRLMADGYRDGLIDQRDYDVWRMNFGAVHGGVGSSQSGPAVPEPASIVPALVVGLFVIAGRTQEL